MTPLRLCPSCMTAVETFGPGPSGRPDASCPHCGSLERDRLLALLLQGMAPYVASTGAVLDVAPSPSTTRVLRHAGVRTYVRLDFDPGADRRSVDVQGSITALPFPDASFDLAICYHVLEHVPDDRAGMRELARVLKPGGFALVQVPWRPGTATDEDPSAPVEERIRRFGQADHVRYYGDEFEERLAESGLSVFRLTAADVLAPGLVDMMRLVDTEPVWIMRPGPPAPPVRPKDRALQLQAMEFVYNRSGRAVDELAATVSRRDMEIRRLNSELRTTAKRADLWERRYTNLRGRLPLRAAAAGARLVGRTRRSLQEKVAQRS